MKEFEKLRVLLPHWIEHNNGHETECIRWAELARSEGWDKVAEYIEDAVTAMKEADRLLEKALLEAGGPSSSSGHSHPHTHHHHD